MKKQKSYILGSAMLLSLALLFITGPKALAATRTWTGNGSDTNMTTAGNWSSGAPVAGDDLVFPDTATVQVFDNDYANGTSFNSLSFTGSSGTANYSIDGNTLDVGAGGITASATSTAPAYHLLMNLTFSVNAAVTVNSASSLGFYGTFDIDSNTVSLTANGEIALVGNLMGSSGGILNKNGASNLLLDEDSSGFNGDEININTGTLQVLHTDALNTGSGIKVIADGADIEFDTCSPEVTNNTFNGGNTHIGDSSNTSGDFPRAKMIVKGNCSAATDTFDEIYGFLAGSENVTITGDVLFDDEVTFYTTAKTVTWTGNIGAPGNILTMLPGYEGNLVMSGTQLGGMTNGTKTSPTFTKTLSNAAASNSVLIQGPSAVTINGTRDDTTVKRGGTVKGSGILNSLTVNANGHVAPGNSPGCLNTGNLVISGALDEEIGGTTACTQYDQIKVTGTANVTSGTLNVSLVSGFTPANGDSFTIIDNDSSDAVTGTFSGLAEGATFTASSMTWKISYVGGSGNDVVLTLMSTTAAGTTNTPSAPNTGFGLISSNQMGRVAIIGLIAIGILALSRRYQKVTVKKRR